MLTARREFAESGGTASRIVLRCTREPEEHDLRISIEPYSSEEKEQLETLQERGDPLVCRRCGTAMEQGTVRIADAWTDSVNREEGYSCPWCGVKWLVSNQPKCQQVS
jgi:DNA-directed RNA polymerase subunit RPC12/RpoP